MMMGMMAKLRVCESSGLGGEFESPPLSGFLSTAAKKKRNYLEKSECQVTAK